MKLHVSLFSNGSMLSTYADGRPAYRYSGNWSKLRILESDIRLYKKSGLPANELVSELEAHFVVQSGGEFNSLPIPDTDLKELSKLIKIK